MRVCDMETKLVAHDPDLVMCFASRHASLDPDRRSLFFQRVPPLTRQPSLITLRLQKDGHCYDLLYEDTKLVKIMKGVQLMARGFIIRGPESDLSADTYRYEVIYDETTNMLSGKENVLLRGSLFTFEDEKRVTLCEALDGWTDASVERRVVFKNEDGLAVVYFEEYAGAPLRLARSGRCCYTEQTWRPGENFAFCFDRLWQTYTGTFLE